MSEVHEVFDREKLPIQSWNERFEELSDELFKSGASESREDCYRIAVGALTMVARMLHELASAEGVRPYAHWVEMPNPEKNIYMLSQCSRCGNREYTLSTKYLPYCSQCGCRMADIPLNLKKR